MNVLPACANALQARRDEGLSLSQQPQRYGKNSGVEDTKAKKRVSESRKVILFLRMLLNVVLTVVLFGLPLFLPAGSFEFWNAWLFLGIFVVEFATILTYFAVANPTYAEKRFQASEQEITQRIVMVLLVLSALGMFVIAGFNYRYGWSSIPLGS